MEEDFCQEFRLRAALYLEEEATIELQAHLEGHLAGCSECRIWVDTFRKTVALFQALPRPDLPAEARERLLRSLALDDFITSEWDES